MKKTFKGLFSLLLVVAIIASLFTFSTSAASSEPAKYSKEYNSGERGVVCTTLSGTSAGSYYSGTYTYDKLSDMSASSLKSSLSTLMRSTHKYVSSYNDCHYKAHQTDCENENGKSNKLLLIYTSYTATQSQWNGWNREHVWPKSLGGNNTNGGGADLHHIRPSDAGVNSSRGNKKYGEAGAGATAKYGTDPATGYLGGTYNSTYFEPNDDVKGDVARICLYVLVRWGSDWGADSITEVFQSVDVLLEWCEMDPVDTWEMGRNEVVQNIQGNRNVFIDYPEYAWILYGREIPSDMVTPSGMAMSQDGGSDSGDSGNQGGSTGGSDSGDSGNQGGSTGGSDSGDSGNQGGSTGSDSGDSGNQGGSTGGNDSGNSGNQGGSTGGNDSGNSGNQGGATECTHPNLVVEGKVASCTDMGYTGDKTCPDCGFYEEGEYTFPEGHKVGTLISDEDGVKFYICSECGEGIYEGESSEDASWFDSIVAWFESIFEWIKNLFKS